MFGNLTPTPTHMPNVWCLKAVLGSLSHEMMIMTNMAMAMVIMMMWLEYSCVGLHAVCQAFGSSRLGSLKVKSLQVR